MLTVMFATHDGAAVLPDTLASLARATAPAGGWKLVVVDNASSDDSAAGLLRSYLGRLPLTILSAPEPGKNRALNRALELAEGDVYVFCDDDVIVAQDWLVQWRRVADAQPDYDLFAGSTRPSWPGGAPDLRLGDDVVSIVFGTNEHMREGPCSELCVLGTNMAVRAQAFADGLRFDARIGPDGSRTYPMGSETDLARRLGEQGRRCWFASGPQVGHIIRPHQFERLSILQRGYRWGRGQAHMGFSHHYGPGLLSRKNRLRSGLYPLLMRFYGPDEAWARQWEWVADQGYEDGWRERNALPPRWMRPKGGPRIAGRFRQRAANAKVAAIA